LEIDLPDILKIPPKLISMLEKLEEYAYFLLHGGRGGGKSQAIARFLLYLTEKKKLRICCGRETQNSIDESVYTILKDLISEHNLNFEVYSAKIVHRVTGSTFIFKGFREQGRVNIKGLEGVDILWIDESQSVTQPTLDIIIPTIRKEKSKVFFSMNRFKSNDPVFKEFDSREDCLSIKINYTDNPFCPQKLLHEAEESKLKGDDGNYNHIWLGNPLDDSDNCLFTQTNLTECRNFEFHYNEALYGCRIGAFDIARMGSDRSAFVVLEQKGPMQWEEIYTEVWQKKDLAHTTGRILDRIGKFKLDISVVDGDGMGAGPRDIANFFQNTPKDIVEFRASNASPDDINVNTGAKRVVRRHSNLKSWAWWQVKDLIENGWLRLNDDSLITDLESIMYDFKPNGERFIVSKAKMKALGLKSPDVGDALMMAVSEIRHINKISDMKASNLPKYANANDKDLMGLPRYAESS